MEAIYLNDFAEPNWRGHSGLDAVLDEFDISPGTLEGARILVASYTYECYEGDAFVLFERDGKLFEVHGSHCSCFGLEGQWAPEEVSEDVLRQRLNRGTYGEENTVKEHIFKALDAIKEAHND